jgi:hypothetical protein
MLSTITVTIIIAVLSALASGLAAGIRGRFRRDIRLVFKAGQSALLPLEYSEPEEEVSLKIDEVVGKLLPNEAHSITHTSSERNASDFNRVAIEDKWSTLREAPLSKPDMPASLALSVSRRNLQRHALHRASGEDKENEPVIATAGVRSRRGWRLGMPDDEEAVLPDLHAKKVYAPLRISRLPDEATRNLHRRRASRSLRDVYHRQRENYA